MNRLLQSAPTKLTIGGIDYHINASYRIVLHMISVAKNEEIADEDKPFILIKNLYKDFRDKSFFELRMLPDEIIVGLIEQMNWFVRGGKDEKESDKQKNKQATVCFEQDGEYIHAAFLKRNVDLDLNKDIHWWTWKSHFSELPECFLTRLMYLRNKMRQPKGLDKDEKKECANIGWDIVNIKVGGVDMAGNIDIWNL